LVLAQELGDRAVEAQSCYSLGNTYTLLRDYPVAVEYHLRHLIIAQQLMDRVGEGMLKLIAVKDFSSVKEVCLNTYQYLMHHLEECKLQFLSLYNCFHSSFPLSHFGIRLSYLMYDMLQ
jgi:hypothetical protein